MNNYLSKVILSVLVLKRVTYYGRDNQGGSFLQIAPQIMQRHIIFWEKSVCDLKSFKAHSSLPRTMRICTNPMHTFTPDLVSRASLMCCWLVSMLMCCNNCTTVALKFYSNTGSVQTSTEESYLVKKQVFALSDTGDSLSHVSESVEIWFVVHFTPKADAKVHFLWVCFNHSSS